MHAFFVVVSVYESIKQLSSPHLIKPIICQLSFHELLDHNCRILWLSPLIQISNLISLLLDVALGILTFQIWIVLQKLCQHVWVDVQVFRDAFDGAGVDGVHDVDVVGESSRVADG